MGVLGRVARTHHQPAVGRLLNHHLVEEEGSPLQDGISLAQELLVPGVEVVLPQMLAQPCTARSPHARRRIVDGTRHAPDVGVVMEHPAVGAVHHLRTLLAGLAHLADEAEEGLVEVGQISDFRRPVVHFQVDVAGILAVPRGEELVVPDALQVGRLSTGLRRADEQVAPELEVGRHEEGVVGLLEVLHPLVRRDVGIPVFAQMERSTVLELLVVFHMAALGIGIVLADSLRQVVLGTGDVVSRDVLVVVEVRPDGRIDDSLIGMLHRQDSVAVGHHATASLHGRASLELHLALECLVERRDSFQRDVIALGGNDDVLVRTGHGRIERHLPGLACRHTGDDNLVGKRSERLALEAYPVDLVAHHGTGGVQAQLAVVVGVAGVSGEVQPQVAEGLVRHTLIGLRLDMCRAQVLCLLVLPRQHELAYLGQPLPRFGTGVVVRASCPDGLFVELELLGCGVAVEHRAQTSVTQREGFRPDMRRLVVPQLVLLCLQREKRQPPCGGH